MRIFAISDVHVDYAANAQWIAQLSQADYVNDVLILAGDVSDSLARLEWTLGTLAVRFRRVLFVPGNHDLWVLRDEKEWDSLDKFEHVGRAVERAGASMQRYVAPGVEIVPLFSWYDYSFGMPSAQLSEAWMDFRACRWPREYDPPEVARHFAALNAPRAPAADKIITFSHFVPRIDVMPDFIPPPQRIVYPVLGAAGLDAQVRAAKSSLHVYGHSHVNRHVEIDGVTYINNALGYPKETRIAAKRLLCVHAQ